MLPRENTDVVENIEIPVGWPAVFVTAEDGPLTISISAQPPGPEAQSNWLPAPDGPFWMVMRNHGPGESILNGTYGLPPVHLRE